MDTNTILIIQSITVIITIIYVILISKTIISNKRLNQQNIFNEIVRQERDLKIKLLEYRDKINNEKLSKKKRNETKLDYDTLLFNCYEFLAICLHNGLINEKETRLFFKTPLISVKDLFESSLLFKEGYAKKEQYKGIQWLFRKWNI